MSPVYFSISNARSRCLCFKFNHIQTFFSCIFRQNFDECFPYWGNCRPTQPFPESTSLPCHRRRCPQLTHAQLVCKGRAAQALWIVELCCFLLHVSACTCLHCIRGLSYDFLFFFWRFAAELRAFVVAVNLLVLSIGMKKEEFTSPGRECMPHSFQSTTGIYRHSNCWTSSYQVWAK